jgi:3-isopropylmalate/(R)-2-methylmalate dehydratase large subunit
MPLPSYPIVAKKSAQIFQSCRGQSKMGDGIGPKTMFEKIWARHAIARDDDETLLYVDRCLFHEGSTHSFVELQKLGRSAARPRQLYAFADHYVPTDPHTRLRGKAGITNPEICGMVDLLDQNTRRYGIQMFGIDHEQVGILHVAGPELGITQPGIVLVGGDSHTSTHGAFGNFSFGIGSSELTHVFATQTLWQRQPANLRIVIDGRLGFGITAKDAILAVIAQIGIGGAIGHVIEYCGSTIRGLSMEERMTVCNMSIEAGARAGMIAPDDTTYDYLSGRQLAPGGQAFERALRYWRTLPTDEGATFDKTFEFDAADIAPMVTWGTNPGQALPITERVPDPAQEPDTHLRDDIAAALGYMGLKPGLPLSEIRLDRVFIGSCTNSRIDDLRSAAAIAKLGHAVIPAWVVPGSRSVKRQAEAEGLDRIFAAAGFDWREPGCSLCTALNGDTLNSGERCGSTSNRNFQGRQGPGGRTHLMSPAMAAAAALTGRLTDVRQLGQRR